MEHSKEEGFAARHIGPRDTDIQKMLSLLGFKTLREWIQKTVPDEIKSQKPFHLPPALSEGECLNQLQQRACENQVFKSYIGRGYYESFLPPVIQRNVLENPVWLTPYTPYQSEISQGRLEALLNFQTLTTELTGMEVATSSLLDEATACAEAVLLAYRNRKNPQAGSLWVDACVFPQTLCVLQTRIKALGLKMVVQSKEKFKPDPGFFCALGAYPNSEGMVGEWTGFFKKAKASRIMTVLNADPLALCLLKTPGGQGADMVAGCFQRFGLPLWFGGPHTGFLATKKEYIRSLPGRIVGVSKDRHGNKALRLTLQTREQHIRREKATSNICTAQALLSVLASFYAIYQGPGRLKKIACRVHLLALRFARALKVRGFQVRHTSFFDTVQVPFSNSEGALNIYNRLLKLKINALRPRADILSFSFDETKTERDLEELLSVFPSPQRNTLPPGEGPGSDFDSTGGGDFSDSPLKNIMREGECLKHPVFQSYHSETALLRYIRRLGNKDLSLAHSMIPLGSCTMKLNAGTELLSLSRAEFGKLHPFAPGDQTKGCLKIIQELESYLCEITGFDAVSFQPNAGSQGEYAGLMMIRRFHEERGDTNRRVCLIPVSAHGTNAASATLAGLKVVPVLCEKEGPVCKKDLEKKLSESRGQVAALMITYPSTYGVFEKNPQEICRRVREEGGLVYLDGANMNAMVGITRPRDLGVDVCHLNLHKTFCIPHGGGGPGVGPVAVTHQLKHLLPTHPALEEEHHSKGKTPVAKAGPTSLGTQHLLKEKAAALSPLGVSAAPFGSAGLLPVSWAYIRLMGAGGLKRATELALLNANYMAYRLRDFYRILYTGEGGFVAHEFVLDFRKFKNSVEVSVDDVAKRLMDFGFHAPTMSWPVAGTLMLEPTESENLQEMDRFCDALIQIRRELQELEDKKYSVTDNVFRNAPHTLEDAVSERWPFPYTRQKAFYPLPFVREDKFWPSVSRVENAYGDINLFCSCPPVSPA